MRRSAVRGAALCVAVRCCAVWRGGAAVRRNAGHRATRHGATWCGERRCGDAWSGAARCSVVWHSMARRGTVGFGAVQSCA
eukprot:10114323-Alexandrium_andersonii.AAC.1